MERVMTNNFLRSPTVAANEYVNIRDSGFHEKLYNLGFGESAFPIHPILQEELISNSSDNRYSPLLGKKELRRSISSYEEVHLRTKVSTDFVVCGPGTKILIYAILRVIEGDVLLIHPYWPTYLHQALLLGKKVVVVPSEIESEYRITKGALIEAYENALKKGYNPRILVLNNPNNPSGIFYEKKTLEIISEFCRKRRIVVISDEIYSALVYKYKEISTIYTIYPEGTIYVNGPSKYLSLGGWRFGYTILPQTGLGERIISSLESFIGSTWSCVSSPIQNAIIRAYANGERLNRYVKTCKKIYEKTSLLIYNTLKENCVRCPRPTHSYYLYPNFNYYKNIVKKKYGITSVEDFVKFLLEEHSILALPGTVFGSKDEDLTIRLSLSRIIGNENLKGDIENVVTNANVNQWLARDDNQIFRFVKRIERVLEDIRQ